jgi:transposase InsO family protein
VVGLDRSTYYDIKFRKPGDREIRRLLLADAIADIHTRSRGTYGILRVKAALEIEQGLIVNTKLVKRIMRELGLKGLPGPKKGYKNLKNARTCEDLVKREFKASAPNELWLTDITEHPTSEGKLYRCVVLDLYSRKAVGWAIDRRCEAALVLDAINKAGASRTTSPSTVIHSDHGSQGGFNWLSQHLDHGGVRWGRAGSRCRRRQRVRGGSGQRIERSGRRCVHRAGRSRLVRCSGSSGG